MHTCEHMHTRAQASNELMHSLVASPHLHAGTGQCQSLRPASSSPPSLMWRMWRACLPVFQATQLLLPSITTCAQTAASPLLVGLATSLPVCWTNKPALVMKIMCPGCVQCIWTVVGMPIRFCTYGTKGASLFLCAFQDWNVQTTRHLPGQCACFRA